MFHVKKKLDSYTYESNQAIQNAERLRNVNLDHPLARGLAVARVASSNGIVSGKYAVCGRKLIPAEIIGYTLPVFIADKVTTGECTIVAGLWRDNSAFSTNRSYIQLTGPDTGQAWDTNIEHLLLNTTGSTTEERILLLHNSSSVGTSGNIQGNSTYTNNIVTVNAAGSGSASLYRNGALTYASAIKVGTFPWNAGTTRNLSVGNAELGMYATHLFFYTRALTDSERAELDGDPFQIFEPKKIWIPVSATPAREIADEPDASIAFGPYPAVQRPSMLEIKRERNIPLQNITDINWSNPLTKGLAFAWVATDITLDMISGKRGTITGVPSNVPNKDHQGILFNVVNSAGVNFGIMQPILSKLNVTLVAVAAPVPVALATTLFGQGSPTGGSSIALLINSSVSASNAGHIAFLKRNTTANSHGASVASQCDGNWHTYAFAADATNGSAFRYARDGIYQSVVGNDSSGTYVESDAEFAVNNRPGVTTVAAVPIALVLAFNHGMNQQELEQITSNPWQIFTNRELTKPFPGPRSLITQASSPSKIKKRVYADVQEIPNNIISGFSDNLEINYEHPLVGNLISWVIPPRRAYRKIVNGVGYYERLAYTSSSNVFATGPYTVVTKLYYDDRTTQTQFSTVLTITQYTTWATDIDEIGITTDTGANIFVFKRQNTSSLPASIAGPSTGSVVDTSIVVPSTSGGNGSSWVYMNGTYYSINTPFGSTPTFATGKTRTVAAGSVSAKVYAAYLFVFNKQLSLAEINSVHRDPWGLLKATPYNTSKFAYIKSADSGILVPPVLSNPSVSDITTTTALPSVKVEF